MDVINIVIVVDVFARWGIFNKLLLIIIKNNLAANANPAPRMKCQLKIIFKISKGVKLLPLMKERDPVSRMETTVTIENKRVYIIT